ncbi:hypothetical protein [Mycobacterium camsae]|uniref:hypothetical protein n=1 Tax=Mycobacterium gordonae TaxID=1778 RepID=UPI00197DCE80|nr:hypothetical protein [Mycobacterium gordonae]
MSTTESPADLEPSGPSAGRKLLDAMRPGFLTSHGVNQAVATLLYPGWLVPVLCATALYYLAALCAVLMYAAAMLFVLAAKTIGYVVCAVGLLVWLPFRKLWKRDGPQRTGEPQQGPPNG